MSVSLNKIALILVSFISIRAGFSQKMELTEGSFQSLASEKTVHIIFSYDEATDQKFKEKEFWRSPKKETYEKNFEILFTKHSGIECLDSKTSLTILVHLTKLEPGSYRYMTGGKKAVMSCTVKLLKSNNQNPVIAVLQLRDVPGTQPRIAFGTSDTNYNMDASMRITEAFSKAGKTLATYVAKTRGK